MTKPYGLRLFTLRLWPEVTEGEHWEWRGEVKNTSNGEVRYFRDFHRLIELLPMLLAEPRVDDCDRLSHAEYGCGEEGADQPGKATE